MTDLVDLIVAVHDHLDDAEIAHAFGGALALAYVAEPRGTVDIDVNAFVPDDHIDLDERYATVAARVEHHPFGRGDAVLPFLSAEDLCVFKLSSGRAQDWVDVEQIGLARPALDLAYVEEQLLGLRGPTMHQRLARFRGMLRR